jgi:GRAS domain family
VKKEKPKEGRKKNIMSLIRAATESTYGGPNLYNRKGTPNRSGVYHYELDPYSPELYPQPYMSGSSLLCNQCEPSIPGSLYDLQVSSNLYQLMANSTSSPILLDRNSSFTNSISSSNISDQSPQSVLISDNSLNFDVQMDNLEFDEDEIQMKLQELEHALLGGPDDDLINPYQGLDLDGEPVRETPIKEIQTPASPKEYSSESSVSCNGEARTPKQLLFDSAAAISEGSIEVAKNMIDELRKQVSIQGDPFHRLAAYLTEGLAARIESSGNGIYKALKCKEPPSSYQLSAMQILFEVCPCFRFGFMAANYAIIEACRGERKVHIIDFDINQGTQYINLIQALSSHPNKPKKLRITGVDDPESVQRQIGGLRIIGQRLEKLAEDCKIEFEFQAIAGQVGEIGPEMLECRMGEAVMVNFAFQLHHMPDESVSTINERDGLLRMVKGLRPKLVTVVEQDVNANTAPFYTRYYHTSYFRYVFVGLVINFLTGQSTHPVEKMIA